MGRPKLGKEPMHHRLEMRVERDLFELTEADRLAGRFNEHARRALALYYTADEEDRIVGRIAEIDARIQEWQAERKSLTHKLRASRKAKDRVKARHKAEDALRGQIRKHLAHVRAQASKAKSRQLTVQWQKWLEARVRQHKVVPLIDATRILREEVHGLADDLVQRVEHRR